MSEVDYRNIISQMRVSKSLGQNFLINAEIARAEAEHAVGKRTLELGPGLGVLTKELCAVAKSVVAVERDRSLFEFLKLNMKAKNLELINADFFDVDFEKRKNIDIMVSNIPYNLSSKTISWLVANNMPALLCLQKEFVGHLLAKPDTRSYSRLSVITSLQFHVYELQEVEPNNFYPMPRVSSVIVFLKPKSATIDHDAIKTITLLMNHKKKKLRNAILDSVSGLGVSKEQASRIADSMEHKEKRVFKLSPEDIYKIAIQIKNLQRG